MRRKLSEKSEVNRIHNEEAETMLVTGLIEDQSRLKEIKLGLSDMAYAGCEVIAVYNAARLLGKEYKLSELICNAERSGALMRNGKWGTNPFSLDRLCPDEEIIFKRIKELPTESGIYILSFWNSQGLFGGVHTVCMRIGNGEIKLYNYNGTMEMLQKNKPIITISEIMKE